VEHYEKGEIKELEDRVKMKCILENAVHMNVNAGSKIFNLMKFAEKKMNVSCVFFVHTCICALELITVGTCVDYNKLSEACMCSSD